MTEEISINPIGIIHTPYHGHADIPIQGRFKSGVGGRAELVSFLRAQNDRPRVFIQDPSIFSRVSNDRPQRSFCRKVPLDITAPPASPTLTPMAVTMPGQ